MLNMNFVPDDYVQNNRSQKINLIYLGLFAVVMAGMTAFFVSIKLRERSCEAEAKLLSERIGQMQEKLKQIDNFQAKRREIMKTALTTMELLEPVPRSVLMALLTNNLPQGVSLTKVKFEQKQVSNDTAKKTKSISKFQKKSAQTKETLRTHAPLLQQNLRQTKIFLQGIAPSDLQVADYINLLSNSRLLDNVAMIESREIKEDDTVLRQFTLTAEVDKEKYVINEDIKDIRKKS